MEVLHQAEKPGALVLARLFEAFHHADLLPCIANAVALHAIMRQLALLRRQPRRRQRRVGEQEEAEDGHEGGHRAFTVTCQCTTQTAWRTETYRMKSHRQPAMPRTPSIPANTPAAISPENPVARIWAQ
jgi:hypothetical protein